MGAGTYAKQGGENVSAEIIIAGLSLLGTLAGTAGGIIVSGKLVNYRIEQLEKKVEKHNNLITRTFRLEQAVALLKAEGETVYTIGAIRARVGDEHQTQVQ